MPACASLEVYPRVCGGTIRLVDDPNIENGLSPRVRGNPCACTKP